MRKPAAQDPVRKRRRRGGGVYWFSSDRSRHLEVELVALVAEVRAFAVHHVAVDAFERVAVVRRHVRVRGLDVLCFFNERVHFVAARADVHGGFGRRLLAGVTGFALEAELDVTVGEVFRSGGREGRDGEHRRTKERENRGRTHGEGDDEKEKRKSRIRRSRPERSPDGPFSVLVRRAIRPSWRILPRRSCRR